MDLLSSVFADGFNFEVDCSSSGTNTIYAVPAGVKMRVYSLFLQAEGDVTIQVRSASNDLTGVIDFTTAAGRERTFANAPFPVFKTVASGEDLILNLGGAVQVNGTGFATLGE